MRQSKTGFEAFHREHPEVYTTFRRYALKMRRRGFSRYSARTIWEVMRFNSAVDARDGQEQFKLNDHWIPFYARKLMADDPLFAGFFETRDYQRRAA